MPQERLRIEALDFRREDLIGYRLTLNVRGKTGDKSIILGLAGKHNAAHACVI